MLINQNLDMLPLKWMDYLGEADVLTKTDFNKFVREVVLDILHKLSKNKTAGLHLPWFTIRQILYSIANTVLY